MLAHRGSSDFWGFLCIIGRSLSDNIKCLEVTVVVIWSYINKIELKSEKNALVWKYSSWKLQVTSGWRDDF